jgi:hypothetical protein
MTHQKPTPGLQAAILCSGYSVGYYSDADIERWAERQIDLSDVPSLALIELATVRGKCSIDVMNLLRSLFGELPPSVAIEARIGYLGLAYQAKNLSLEKAIRGLFLLVHDQGVTQEQQSMIYWLDDAYDLAGAGTYGSLDDVLSEFHSFVLPYANRLKAQEVEMFGPETRE